MEEELRRLRRENRELKTELAPESWTRGNPTRLTS